MENAPNFMLAFTGNLLSAAGAAMSITEFQAIFSMVVTGIGFLLTIVTTVIIPLWKKIRDAKKDGKITPEEAEDIANNLQDNINKLK